MKKIIGLVSFSLIIAAYAANEKPWLVKYSVTGYVPSEQRQENQCDVYPNKIVITRTADQVTTKETKNIELKGDVQKLLKDADGKEKEMAASTDNPITRYYGYRVEDGKERVVKLKSRGSEWVVNESRAAVQLVNILDQNCPIKDLTKN